MFQITKAMNKLLYKYTNGKYNTHKYTYWNALNLYTRRFDKQQFEGPWGPWTYAIKHPLTKLSQFTHNVFYVDDGFCAERFSIESLW